jgi:Ni/Co efflux regulator RcnB
MKRLTRLFAIVATAASLAGGGALARDHHDGGDPRGHGGERGGAPPWARGGERGGGERGGGAPPWSRGVERGGGRWERPPAEAYGPPPGYYAPRNQPPPGYYAPRGQPRRGGYLPPEARGGVVQDYGRYRLRPPPRGYAWVRSGHAMMLMDMDTGQVFDVIPD